MTTIVLLFSIIVFTIFCGAQSSNPRPASAFEQTRFSAEDRAVEKPVPIPRQVLDLLRADRLVVKVLESENLSATQLPQNWFSASAIHLSANGPEDLIVVGEPPLAGGNTVPFWIFIGVHKKFQMALSSSAHDLKVLSARSKGYKEVELSGPTSSRFFSNVYRFDGNSYVVYRSNEKSIP
jgi:hypothetical protein